MYQLDHTDRDGNTHTVTVRHNGGKYNSHSISTNGMKSNSGNYHPDLNKGTDQRRREVDGAIKRGHEREGISGVMKELHKLNPHKKWEISDTSPNDD